MSDCCSSSCTTQTPLKKLPCPVNGDSYKAVPLKTILHHISQPWAWAGKDQAYYFCDDADCDVVYFGADGTTISRSALRTTVGIKDRSADATLCYCFGVSRADARANPQIRAYVTEQTKHKMCDCEIRNPSGKCCLKDFPTA
ncbi:MAG: hypothetical protein ISR73_06140 [Gammaproteobacteria bacterium]|nr:hypothetical protein [Gammaproteobacteria bacterium]